jgi:hypothetical protein
VVLDGQKVCGKTGKSYMARQATGMRLDRQEACNHHIEEHDLGNAKKEAEEMCWGC